MHQPDGSGPWCRGCSEGLNRAFRPFPGVRVEGDAGDMAQHERLFLMTDPVTHQVVGMCTGPDTSGRCPRAEKPPYDCVGLRVIPSVGSDADGLPFTVSAPPDGRCPFAWMEEREADDAPLDAEDAASDPDR